jgi:hypothetical protein
MYFTIIEREREGRREGGMKKRKRRRKEGGRKEGRKDGRKEGRKEDPTSGTQSWSPINPVRCKGLSTFLHWTEGGGEWRGFLMGNK